ncbi:hypothetical protein TNIN_26131 [Trichonephila inaurata madagascariensis]|uniref:Uncharacterized protein n=1 Tax=Trichonephila inaurata madagascariensis TaxID=2747483 RepID=A0A8X7BX17_9ARAC|nr:hypothetical protein TNIN_26131 [Trichonephila inaurata madagascariensis]
MMSMLSQTFDINDRLHISSERSLDMPKVVNVSPCIVLTRLHATTHYSLQLINFGKEVKPQRLIHPGLSFASALLWHNRAMIVP